jgi:hypothetical protein
MLAFPGMLRKYAWQAGMPTPPDADQFDPEQYPHFQVFCHWQLGRSLPGMTAPQWNADLIANIPDEEIRKVTWHQLESMGAC